MNDRPDSLMRALAHAILQAEDAAACDTTLEQLEAFVTLQLDGVDYVAAMPAVAAHLDACVACSQSYALLYQTVLAERSSTLPVPQTVPAPDLSFLPSRPSLGTLLRSAVQQLGSSLRLQLSQTLLDLMRPTGQPSLAFRDAEGDPLFSFDLPAPSQAVERLMVAVYADDRASDLYLVQVSVALPGRAWPDLAGIAVHLRGPELDQQAATDPWGEVSFDNIPSTALPQLVIEVLT